MRKYSPQVFFVFRNWVALGAWFRSEGGAPSNPALGVHEEGTQCDGMQWGGAEELRGPAGVSEGRTAVGVRKTGDASPVSVMDVE